MRRLSTVTAVLVVVLLAVPTAAAAGSALGSAGAEPGKDGPQDPRAVLDDSQAGCSAAADVARSGAPSSGINVSEDLLVVGVEGGFYHVRAGDGSVQALDLPDPAPDRSWVSGTRWGQDGNLYATVWGEVPRLVRLNPTRSSLDVLVEGAPLAQPRSVLPLGNGTVLVADGGEAEWGAADTLQGDDPRVMAFDTATGLLETTIQDPRFASTHIFSWMDIARTPDGSVYLTTGGTDHRVATPTNRTDDGGRGALWSLSFDQGQAQLVASDERFRLPEGLTALPGGDLAVADWSAGVVFSVHPETGATGNLAAVDGASNLYGLQTLDPGSIAVADYWGDPHNLTPEEPGPGVVWIVDTGTGDASPLVVDPCTRGLAQVRTWPDGGAPVSPSETEAAQGQGAAGFVSMEALSILAAVALGLGRLAAGLWPELRSSLPFTRVDRDELLDHPRRSAIRDALEDRPGMHFEQLAERLETGHGILEHHLRLLLDANLIVEHKAAGRRCFFPPAEFSSEEREALALLKAEGARELSRELKAGPAGSLTELADRAGLSTSTVSYHVDRLADTEVLRVEAEGRARRVTLTSTGSRLLERVRGS